MTDYGAAMTSIYHNPRCSKSRAALSLLGEHGINPEVILYLDHPPDVPALRAIIEKLGGTAHDIIRDTEQIYKDLGLSDDVPEAVLLEAIAGHPILLQRPIVVSGDKAAIGRPPERVLSLITQEDSP